ncbi:MAG: WecB/TagA/CpsF family glycosyltransferase, partial [Cyanobacteria bacterium J06648_11]
FYRAYRSATYRICDSQILVRASQWLGTPIREKLSGSDFFADFYRYYADDRSMSIYLLGAEPGVAQTARERINAKVGRHMVVAAQSPSFGFEQNETECEALVADINRSRASVLAVGVGSPKQELWIEKYRARLQHVRIIFAIGATIDFEAGYKQRSPRWVSQAGIEWLFRLASEPRRLWKRYLIDDLPFLWLALLQKLRRYRSPWALPVPQRVERDNTGIPAYASFAEYRNTFAWNNASTYLQPIGQLLLQAGLLSTNEIEAVLQEQHRYPERRFGDIVDRNGWLSAKTVAFFVWSRSCPESERYPRSQRIGDYLTASALLSEDQLQSLLVEQHTSPVAGTRLGELAVRHGWIKPKTLAWFLDFMGITEGPDSLSYA